MVQSHPRNTFNIELFPKYGISRNYYTTVKLTTAVKCKTNYVTYWLGHKQFQQFVCLIVYR